jgi:sterol desaturase/sphingolipid hydroxylase (fatty acid hydroxylase superfamily)
VTLTSILGWVTVVIGLVLSIKGIESTLYFRRRRKIGTWVMEVMYSTVLIITVACLTLTLARAYTLLFGPAPWTPVIGGIAVTAILTIPWFKLTVFRAHEE